MKNLLYVMCAVLLLGACEKNVHDEPKAGNGFLSVALIWEDKFNSADEIKNVNLWIYDMAGKLAAERMYLSTAELSLQKYEIEAGSVAVVIGVNVNDPVVKKHTAKIEDLKFELARQCAKYGETYYGDKAAEVVDGESRVVYVSLHDKPHDDTFIGGEGDINDWEDGEDDNGEILNPNK